MDFAILYKRTCINPGTESYMPEWIAEITADNERTTLIGVTLDGVIEEVLSMGLPIERLFIPKRSVVYEDPSTFRMYISGPFSSEDYYRLLHWTINSFFKFKSF